MTAIIGACDRTGEFRTCAKSYEQKVIAGRMRLKPSRSTRNKQIKSDINSDFLISSQRLSSELGMTRTKLKKLYLLLEEVNNNLSGTVLTKLIEVIQCDIMDLYKALSELKALEAQIKMESSSHYQRVKHNGLIVVGLEYHMSCLVNEFRKVLENNKDKLARLSQPTPAAASDLPVQPKAVSNLSSAAPCIFEPPPVAPSTPAVTLVPLYSPSSPQQPAIQGLTSNCLSTLNPTASYPAMNNTLNRKIPHQHTGGSLLFQNQSHNLSSPTFDIISLEERPTPVDDQVPLFAQQTQIPLVDQEVRQRDANMKRVESTIVQLGEIYQQFSSLVMEQADIVTRIDSNTEEAELNVGSAHEQLLTYFRSVSARRSFMLKVFGVIFLCFVVFSWIR